MLTKNNSKVSHQWLLPLKWLCLLDLVCILLFVVALFYLPEKCMAYFDLGSERTIPEFYQYAKLLATLIPLYLIACKTRQAVYFGWALLFSYMLLDDAFALHELFGIHINDENSENWIGAKELGEPVASLLAGCLLLSFIAVTYIRTSIQSRLICLDYCLLLGLIVFFGVFIDYIHAEYSSNWWLYIILTVIEDGGEMFAFSMCVAYTICLVQQGHQLMPTVSQSILARLPRWLNKALLVTKP